MSDDENPLPRTDLPEFTQEELEELEARPKDEDGYIEPLTLEQVLRFPKGSLTNWRLVPKEEAEQRAARRAQREELRKAVPASPQIQ